jgi:hypothetical protein
LTVPPSRRTKRSGIAFGVPMTDAASGRDWASRVGQQVTAQG